ncbi:hypothetical protein M422DRAFT_70180 [Sphaerobolus stellatus SS14]|uniref:Uncharacterized protein n=1 Tax=Sphaerobolus stellatus (strain SS14) TaxID=990650 RepID=A0A0C9TWD7_SPHS4|nr:hypothetical protein M422DRAFT_70180 [Sphaerobolus stellatus SS14]
MRSFSKPLESLMWGVLEVNTKGAYLPTRDFLRRNIGCPLTILNTSWILSANTIPGYSVYYSSKSLINRFTEFLHFKYQQDVSVHLHITLYLIIGAIGTDIVNAMPEPVRVLFNDTSDLAAGYALWLITQHDKTEFLR